MHVSDTDSFDAFYRSSYDRTLRYLFAMVSDLPTAQDVTQEAYGRAWRSWPDVRDLADPEAWVRTVGWRVAANHLRHLRVVRRRRPQGPDPVAAPSLDAVLLVDALKRIDAPQRQAIVLHYLLDLPVHQVAEETRVSVSAAKARLVRGRAALAALLGEREETR